MKFFAILVLLTIQGSSLVQGQSIKEIIDEFLDSLKNFIPEEVDLPDLGVDIPENDYVSGYLKAVNGKLAGLQDFDVSVEYRGVIIPIPTGFTISIYNSDLFEDILAALKFKNSSLSYTNEVVVNVITSDLVISGDLDFTLIPLEFSVSSLQIHVGGIAFDIEGILSDRFSEVLSQLLTNNVVNVVNSVLDRVTPLLEDIINDLIKGIFDDSDDDDDNDDNDEDAYVEASPEKSMEKLKLFFETLKMKLGMPPQ